MIWVFILLSPILLASLVMGVASDDMGKILKIVMAYMVVPMKIAAAFGDEKAVCIVKHGNPCGFAIRENLLDAYVEALKCDPVSAFGGVVAVNGIVDEELAKKMNEIFLEVVIAGRITPEAQEVFASKKRIKLFEYGSDTIRLAKDAKDFKHIDGGFVFQDADAVDSAEVRDAKEAKVLAHTYRLAGNTCLAGDIMGDYSFKEPLKVGDKIIFEDQIHYTIVKNTTFNGIKLPNLVYKTKEGEYKIIKEFGYDEYKRRN